MSGGLIPLAVMGTITQATSLLGLGIQIIGLYRALRDKWKEDHPAGDLPTDADGNPVPLVEDTELIGLLKGDAQALIAAAQALQAKYAPAATAEPPAEPVEPAPADG